MILAFDSKEYRREREIQGTRKTLFYTPLGAGIELNMDENIHTTYEKICEEKKKINVILDDCYIYSSGHLSKKYGLNRTCSFLEGIIYGLKDYINNVFLSYVILPPNKIPSIKVGGTFSPAVELPTFNFLNQLNPMFSYITAWNYFQRPRNGYDDIFIDNFSSKSTLAWEELKNRNPKIFPHGDECNLAISIADAIAFVTDRRLNRFHLRLEPDNIQRVWDGYDIKTETRFLTHEDIIYYRWYNFNQINWNTYQARPILFMDVQTLSMNIVVDLEPYKLAIEYISKKGGSLQGFDVHIDTPRIRDGDIYVYAGEVAKSRAMTFKDMYDIEVYSVIELREKIAEEKESI